MSNEQIINDTAALENQKNKDTTLEMLKTVNKVDGFDPSPLAVAYTDMNTNETRWRLPVKAQIAWFRLKYPQGKIAVVPNPSGNHFVAHARVYANYNDPMENFLAEATASRTYDSSKPTISPREWAQTAAIGIALRNAGFGIQYDAAGDSFDHMAFDEMTSTPLITAAGANLPISDTAAIPASVAVVPENAATQTVAPAPVTAQATTQQAPQAPAEPQPPTIPQTEDVLVVGLDDAMKMPCPVKQHSGKTLGEVLRFDPECLVWIAKSYTNDPKISEGARIICEHSLGHAS